MTGFGDFRGQDESLCVAVEVRSVNNRHFKIVVKSPERFQPLEGEIERVVRESITRGTVNVLLRVDGIGASLGHRLDATVLLPGGSGQVSTTSLWFAERTGGAEQLAGSKDIGAVFAVEQPLLDALFALTRP